MDDYGRPKRTVRFAGDANRGFGICEEPNSKISTRIYTHPDSGEQFGVPWETRIEHWGLSGPNGMWLGYRRVRGLPALAGDYRLEADPPIWDISGNRNLADAFIESLEKSRRDYIARHARRHPSPADSQSMPRAA